MTGSSFPSGVKPRARVSKAAILATGMALIAMAALPAAQCLALAKLTETSQQSQPSQSGATAQSFTQSDANQSAAKSSPVNSLRPALAQVQSALGSINIDRWKLSSGWKSELQSDADSIAQDISATLPGLLQTAQAAPASLAPQLGAIHNVDALYDVLVRLTTAASFGGRKDDATALADALRGLEAARKTTSAQILGAAAQQDEQLAKIRAEIARAAAGPQPGSQPKTIIVDNDVAHHRKRRKVTPPKKAPAPPPGQASPQSPGTPR